VSNTEFTEEPICTASHNYQKRKIEQLQSLNLPEVEYKRQYDDVVSKECLCVGLMNSAVHVYSLPRLKNLEAVTICPGPNIAYFNKIVSLSEMIDHIYGRANLLSTTDRPHMFIKELNLNMEYMREQIDGMKQGNEKMMKDIKSFGDQLLKGIRYYQGEAGQIVSSGREKFLQQLDICEKSITSLILELSPVGAGPSV